MTFVVTMDQWQPGALSPVGGFAGESDPGYINPSIA